MKLCIMHDDGEFIDIVQLSRETSRGLIKISLREHKDIARIVEMALKQTVAQGGTDVVTVPVKIR